jgi:hypothetical protein
MPHIFYFLGLGSYKGRNENKTAENNLSRNSPQKSMINQLFVSLG